MEKCRGGPFNGKLVWPYVLKSLVWQTEPLGDSLIQPLTVILQRTKAWILFIYIKWRKQKKWGGKWGFSFINMIFIRNVLHMVIRQEDGVLHVASGLKLQWQFSPWITSHRFQLPLRWYARVRLIRYTFMFPATKHLVSQRDAHLLLETIRPTAALAKHLPPVLTAAAAQRWCFWQSQASRTYADRQHACRGSCGEIGMGSYFFPVASWQRYYWHRAAGTLMTVILPSPAQAKRPLYNKGAVIWWSPAGTNGISVTWAIISTVWPCSRHQVPICPAVYIGWQISSIDII